MRWIDNTTISNISVISKQSTYLLRKSKNIQRKQLTWCKYLGNFFM